MIKLDEYPNAHYCDELSFKNFTNINLQDLTFDTEGEMEILICGSCFFQSEPKTIIFPGAILTLDKVIFHNCNCDNCILPDNGIISGSTCNKLIKTIDDEDWFVDGDLQPISKVSGEE